MTVFHKQMNGKYALGILVIVVIAVITIFLLNLKKTAMPSQKIAALPSFFPTPTATPFASLDLTKNGTQYKAPTYSITYPDTWKPSSLDFQGGQSAIMKPDGMQGNPMIVIEAYNSAKNIVQKQSIYLAEGCKKGSITINNEIYTKLNCVFPLRMIDGKEVKGTTQQQMVYIPKPNALYVIRYYYSSPEPIAEYDTLLKDMLTTFVITH